MVDRTPISPYTESYLQRSSNAHDLSFRSLSAALAEKVARYRAARAGDAAPRALDALETTARGHENLVPRILDAVEAAVTLGEICDRLRAVFGVHQPSVTF